MGKSVNKKNHKHEEKKQEVKKEEKKEVKKEDKQTKQQEQEQKQQEVKQEQQNQQENNDKFEEKLKAVQDEFAKLKEVVKSVNDSLKKMQTLHSIELNKLKKKKFRVNSDRQPTGFAKKRVVTGKLADFLGVESGSELSGPEITKKVWEELKNRDLNYKGDEKNGIKADKRVLRVDKEVSELFKVPLSVNKSTNCKDVNGFNFGNLQKYIKNATDDSTNKNSENKNSENKKSEKVSTK
jgi:hypothetical protein